MDLYMLYSEHNGLGLMGQFQQRVQAPHVDPSLQMVGKTLK